MQARCIVHVPVNKVELRTFELPDPGPGEIISQAIYTAISAGTELRVMRIHAEGKPLLPGYNHIGRVLKRGPGVSLAEGALIYSSGTKVAPGLAINWGGHCSHALLPASNAIALPAFFESEQGLRDACLIKFAAIPFRGLNHSKPLAGERVAVIGLGVIGQLSARLHALAGCQVVGTDMAPARVAVANNAKIPGLSAVLAGLSLKQTFASSFPQGADIVVDCTGDPAVLPSAIPLIRDQPWDDTAVREPCYIVQCSYPGDFSIPYGPAFQRNLSFYLPRDCTTRDRLACVDLIGQGRLSVAGLLSDIRPPEAAPATYAELREPTKTALVTVAFKWS